MWIKSGKKDAVALASEKMEQILATHEPLPLTAKQEQAVEDVLIEARDYYRDRGLISDSEWDEYRKVIGSTGL